MTCGCGGTRTRLVACYTSKGSGILADETECIADIRPVAVEACYVGECPSPYGCDQSYDAEIGTTYSLRSPNYPNNYPNDVVCDRDFVASITIGGVTTRLTEGEAEEQNEAQGYHVEITFTDFDVEFSPNCQFDYVEVSWNTWKQN